MDPQPPWALAANLVKLGSQPAAPGESSVLGRRILELTDAEAREVIFALAGMVWALLPNDDKAGALESLALEIDFDA